VSWPLLGDVDFEIEKDDSDWVGPVGNAPLVFFSKKVAPAVAAGNTVVLKSSEKAPLTVSESRNIEPIHDQPLIILPQ
jgi:hypothetical protein